MVEVIIPSYVIFHLADLEFEHKMDENARRGCCGRNKNQP